MAAFDTYRLGLDDHPPLYLPRPLEAEARGIASAREVVDPLADTLGDLYASIAHMVESRLTPDGANITVEPHQGGHALTKGSDALPFAHIDDERVWVSSAYVVERAPASRKADGKGIGGAMRKLGWSMAKYRGIRGWLRKIEAEPMPCE